MVIIIKSSNAFSEERKALNLPTEDELKKAYLFSDTGPKSAAPIRNQDITIILGSDSGSRYASILLCRFHNFNPKLTEKKNRIS